MYIHIILLALCFFAGACDPKKNYNELSSKKACKEELPQFSIKTKDVQVLKLMCECIWKSFPENGWERKVSKKLYNGEDIGWKIKSFSGIFEMNYKKCEKKHLFQ